MDLNIMKKDQSTAKSSKISASSPGQFGFSAEKKVGLTNSAHEVKRLYYRAETNIESIVLPNNVVSSNWTAPH